MLLLGFYVKGTQVFEIRPEGDRFLVQRGSKSKAQKYLREELLAPANGHITFTTIIPCGCGEKAQIWLTDEGKNHIVSKDCVFCGKPVPAETITFSRNIGKV